MTEEQINFLKELQKQMKYENEFDYDMQASPRFWVIMDYRKVPANEEYDNGEWSYFHNDGDHTEFEDFTSLKEFIEEYYEDEIETNEDLKEALSGNDFEELWDTINEHDGEYFGTCFVKEEEYIVEDTMFLVKKEAKEYLKNCGYNHSPKAHTYAMTAFRSPSVRRLIDLLLNAKF